MDRRAVFVVALALGSSACVERLLHDVECGDGRVQAGELCFEDGEPQSIRVPFSPLSVRVDDFDGDGDRDILVLGVDVAGVVRGSLVAGDGDGGFAPAIDAGVHGCSAYPVPGRFEGEGPADLLVDECDNSMLAFSGSATGVFAAPTRIDVGAITRTSAIVDVDDDDIGDVIVLGDPGDGSSVLVTVHGLVSGGFDPPLVLPVGGRDGTPAAIGFSLGHVDDDGALDAVLSIDGGTEPPMIAAGRTDAIGFADPVPWTAIAPARGVALRDLDDDGVPELVARHGAAPELAVYERAGGEYELAEITDVEDPEALLETGRLDGDDQVDLATYRVGGSEIDLWLGDDLRWEPTTTVDLAAAVSQLLLADLDEDGAADIVAGTFEDGTVTVVRATP